MNALGNLPLDDSVRGKVGMKQHDIRPEPPGLEGIFNPRDKLPWKFLENQQLYVRNVGTISMRNIERLFGCLAGRMGSGTDGDSPWIPARTAASQTPDACLPHKSPDRARLARNRPCRKSRFAGATGCGRDGNRRVLSSSFRRDVRICTRLGVRSGRGTEPCRRACCLSSGREKTRDLHWSAKFRLRVATRTNLSALDLNSLQAVHGPLRVLDVVVLNKAIRRLE